MTARIVLYYVTLQQITARTLTVYPVYLNVLITTTITTKFIFVFLLFRGYVFMGSISSDVLVEVSHIKKESLMKIYLFYSASRVDIIYKDSERIVIKVDTRPETLFIITRNYIAELRNIVNIYILEHEELDLNNLKFDIDIEEECYDNDCDTYFYLKLQTE